MANLKLVGAVILCLCRAAGLFALTEEEISRTLRSEAVLHWSLEDEEHVRIEVLDFSRVSGEGTLMLPLDQIAPSPADGIRVIHGSLRQGTNTSPVWVRARMSFLVPRLVALRDLAARTPLGAADTRIQEVWQHTPPDVTLHLEPTQIEGAKLRRPVGAGQSILLSAVEYPYAVRRGQNVELHVSSGAAHLHLAAVALADARIGDAVLLRVAARDGSITAVVTSPGQARLTTGSLKTTYRPSEGPAE